MTMSTRFLVGLGAALLFCCSAVQAQQASGAARVSLVDRIVAVVGKEVVTMSELNDRIAATEREMRRQGTTAPARTALAPQVLERLILDRAQLQLARDAGISVEDGLLDRHLQRVAEGNAMTPADFRKAVETDGVNFEKFREEVRQQIVLARLREREVDERIQVSESEIDLYIQENMADERAEYKLAHILVRVPEESSPERIEQARLRAEKARAELMAGGDFGALAATYSDGPEALKGGELDWRAADRLPELFAGVLRRMKQGELSTVVRSPAGFHILKLLGRRGADSGAPVLQNRVRHILVKAGDVVSEAEARRRLADLRERIVTGGQDFAAIARQYSEDGSAARGGDLDWIYPGDTVPDFERAMNDLEPGQVSPPVRSPFGFHLIQVMERRTGELGIERRRLQARQALRERKSDEAYQEWLRQLRDQTYVELRLDER